MTVTEFVDDIVDAASILYWIWSVPDHHVRRLTRSMDMDITESEERLEDTCRMCVDLLDSVEWTLGYWSRECRDLIDTDDTRVRDDEEVEFVIDPIQQDKSQKYYPEETECSPIESSTREWHKTVSVCQEEDRGDYENCYIAKMSYEDDPVTMEGHHDSFVGPEKGDVFLLDHVMCGALK
jgi:hypothetical protein